jgi:hypothetical protein
VIEAAEPQHRDIRKTKPGRLELGSEGQQCKRRKLTKALDRKIEELE